MLQNVRREVALMKKLVHPNVVRLLEVIDDPQNDLLFMVRDGMTKRPSGGGCGIERESEERLRGRDRSRKRLKRGEIDHGPIVSFFFFSILRRRLKSYHLVAVHGTFSRFHYFVCRWTTLGVVCRGSISTDCVR